MSLMQMYTVVMLVYLVYFVWTRVKQSQRWVNPAKFLDRG